MAKARAADSSSTLAIMICDVVSTSNKGISLPPFHARRSSRLAVGFSKPRCRTAILHPPTGRVKWRSAAASSRSGGRERTCGLLRRHSRVHGHLILEQLRHDEAAVGHDFVSRREAGRDHDVVGVFLGDVDPNPLEATVRR